VSIYSASLTTGPLLTDETEAVISYMAEHNWTKSEVPIKSDRYIKVNSEAGRKRKLREIRNRIESVPVEYWKRFIDLTSREEKQAFLYYVCMKAYPLVRDFHFEVILNKWRLLDTLFEKDEVSKFLKRASNKHSEIDDWSETTQKKVGQVILLMLKEVGIISKNRIRLVFLPDTFWLFFIEHGEGWFLEAMFLSREQRNFLYKKAGI
jgi:hypothetical protein